LQICPAPHKGLLISLDGIFWPPPTVIVDDDHSPLPATLGACRAVQFLARTFALWLLEIGELDTASIEAD